MTKVKKIVIGTLISIVTLGGLIACASPGHHGKFGGMNADKAEFIVSRISSKLDLNEVQKQNLESLKDTILEQKKLAKGDNNDPRETVKALLSQPVLDEAKVQSLVEERTTRVHLAAPKVISALANFTNSLNDEQRAEIIKMVDKFGKHRGPFGRGFGGNEKS